MGGTNPPSPTGTITVNYQQQTSTVVKNELAGGVRIQKTVDYDGIDASRNVVKVYQYRMDNEADRSSGVLVAMGKPNYNYSYGYGVCSTNGSGTLVQSSSCYNTVRTSTGHLMGATQGSHLGYRQVNVLEGANGENGRTRHYYTSPADYRDLGSTPAYPFTPGTSYDYKRGLLTQSVAFNAAGQIVRVDTNTYVFSNANLVNVEGIGMGYSFKSCLDASHSTFASGVYRYVSQWVYQSTKTERIYNVGAPAGTQPAYLETTTNYFYDNASHQQLSRRVSRTSRNEDLVTVMKYPLDYVIPSASGAPAVALKAMQVKNMVSPVVESQTWRRRSSTDSTLVSAQLTHYKQLASGAVVADTALVLKLTTPLTRNTTTTQTPTSFSPLRVNTGGALVREGKYEKQLQFEQYDALANLQQLRRTDDVASSYVWGYQNTLPLAEVKNATADQVAHTSFETDTDHGSWTYTGVGVSGTSKTGRKYYTLSTTNALTKAVTAGTYLVTYWAKDTLVRVSVSSGTVTEAAKRSVADANGWMLFQQKVVATGTPTLTISRASGSIALDEVRLHPFAAQMTTYTYDPLVGMTSATDAANVTTYYEYDELQRLKRVKDQDGNIVRQQVYHYQGQAH